MLLCFTKLPFFWSLFSTDYFLTYDANTNANANANADVDAFEAINSNFFNEDAVHIYGACGSSVKVTSIEMHKRTLFPELANAT